MKIGTLRNDTRDGALCVVSRDLRLATVAYDVAPTLQAALDDWNFCAPRLLELYEEANQLPTASRWFEPDFAKFHSPLPRAYQWADASAYPSHLERSLKARGVEVAKAMRDEPLMYQGGSDSFLGPREDIAVENEAWGVDLEAEIAIVTDDVPLGVKRDQAGEHIRLFMLANDVTLRHLVSPELAKGFGFFQSKSWTAFSPLAVTPDELGPAWDGRKLRLPLFAHVNGAKLGHPDAGADMAFDFPRLIVHAAKTRRLGAGTIIGSGTVSNRNLQVGVCCLAERRALELVEIGEAKTPFLKFGDSVKIEMLDRDERSIFGAIEQRVVQYVPSK